MSESIFGFSSAPTAPSSPQPCPPAIEPPAPKPPLPAPRPRVSSTSAPAPAQRAPKASWSTSSEVALLAVLEEPLSPYETTAAGFARKEVELRRVMATLSVMESRALQSRLSNPKSGDHLVEAFMRMTADRRARLINFLADARRREATRR